MLRYYVHELGFDVEQNKFSIADNTNVIRYLKGLYPKPHLFERHVLSQVDKTKDTKTLRSILADGYSDVEPFSYKEAFELEDPNFRALVFGSIRVADMIKEMGHKRIATSGMPIKRKQFSPYGEFLGYKEYDSIFEVHEVDGTIIGTKEPLYAVRCWCTSTDKEHWIWIENKYKDDPLDAIASTFRIHQNLIPHIKELKRQGDIMMVELNERIVPDGEIVPLTKEQYFGLLTAES